MRRRPGTVPLQAITSICNLYEDTEKICKHTGIRTGWIVEDLGQHQKHGWASQASYWCFYPELTRNRQGVLICFSTPGACQFVTRSRSNHFWKQAIPLASCNTLAGKTIACTMKPCLQQIFSPFPHIRSGKRRI